MKLSPVHQHALRSSSIVATFLISMLFPCSGQNLGDGLVSYWALDDGLSSADNITIQDLQASNPLELTSTNPASAWLSGSSAKVRGSLRVDGLDTYVLVPTSDSLDLGTNAVTLSLWVKLSRLPSELTESFGGIFDSTNDAYVLYLDRNANELRFKVTASGAQRPGIPAADLKAGEWMHVVGVYDGDAGESRIYANGELKDTHSGPTGDVIPGQAAGIGRNGEEERFFLGSDLDEIAIWNRALTETEILDVMTTGLLPIFDADGDGMRDEWEIRVFGNSSQDGTADGDSDGLTDLQEYNAGTLPTVADSDGDGLPDGAEVTTHLSDPLKADTDGDGLADQAEIDAGTNPSLSDTDGDGLSDADEVTLHQTNAIKADSDDDGFSDSMELAIGTNPLDAAEAPAPTTVFLVRSANPGESWLEPTLWSDGAAPAAGNHYVVPGYGADTLRLTAEGETVFPGDSLTLAPRTQLVVSQTGTGAITIAKLVLNGGHLIQEGSTALTIAGTVDVIADSTIGLPPNGGAFTLASTLNGDSSLTVDAPDDSEELRPFILAGTGSQFAGDFLFDHVAMNARTAGSLGNGNLSLSSSSLDIDYNAYNPESALTLTGDGSRIVLDQFLVFKSLVVAGTTLPDGTYDFAAWEALDPSAANYITDGGGAIVIGGDTDGDRLLDDWELRYFADLTIAAGGDDTDADGLTNEEEFIADSNPTLADTDSDGLTDADEIRTHGTNPLLADTDGDGLTDADEINRNPPTNPSRNDSDGDGLLDGDEVNRYGTDPLLVDSDGDSYSDLFELRDSGDPLDAASEPRLAQLKLLEGLISFWTFDDGVDAPNTNSVGDVLSRNPLNLVSPDPSAAWLGGDDAKLNGSLSVDGSQTYVPVPNTPSLNLKTEAVSIAAWVKLNELPSEMGGSFGGIYDSRNDAFVLYLDRGNAELRFKVTASGGAERPGIPEAELTKGEWLHIAGVYDGSAQESRIYLNGQLMDTHANPTGTLIQEQIASIGRNGDEDASYFSGAIDDLGIWDVALTSTQILALIEGPGMVELDSDGDGLLDSWETEFFGNLDQDGASDPDGDGLSNSDELLAQTNPTSADSDEDSVNDGVEVDLGTDPLDPASKPNIVNNELGVGLAAYWPLNDGLSDPRSTMITDVVGVNPLTLSSNNPAGAWLANDDAAPSGGGVRVDGFNNYIVVPNAPALDLPGDTLTLAMWVRLDQLPTDIDGGFAALYDSTNDAYVFYLDKGNAELRFKVTATGAARPGIPQASLATGEWIHVAGVYDGPNQEGRIYMNGELMNTVAGVSGRVRTGQTAGIGRQGDEETNVFSGGVADVALWNRVLTLSEITALASGSPILGGGDDGTDSDGDGLTDASETSTHGTDPMRADTDRDGMGDGAEVAAGTDPLDSTSRFHITSIEPAAQGITLRWTSIAGRTYTVDYTADLANEAWESLASDVSGLANGETTFTDTTAREDGSGYYRVRVGP